MDTIGIEMGLHKGSWANDNSTGGLSFKKNDTCLWYNAKTSDDYDFCQIMLHIPYGTNSIPHLYYRNVVGAKPGTFVKMI
jgi:hypothetical protein